MADLWTAQMEGASARSSLLHIIVPIKTR